MTLQIFATCCLENSWPEDPADFNTRVILLAGTRVRSCRPVGPSNRIPARHKPRLALVRKGLLEA
jgi:hypothetical protein